MLYGDSDLLGHNGRNGWESESAARSAFPKWYYITVSPKNAFGVVATTEYGTLWDYNCNLLQEKSRFLGYE